MQLFLHEVVDIVGTGTWPYMEHTVAAAGNEKINFELQGTFSVMGVTGRWPQVVNIWECPGGWEGWRHAVDRLNLQRRDNRELDAWWKKALEYRSGGVDRLLVGADGCPSTADLVAQGVRADLFVHHVAKVKIGAASEYAAAVRDGLAPILAQHGHTLTGLYVNAFDETEVFAVWATDVDSHVARWEATHSGADARLAGWGARVGDLAVHWREELMTPCPGIPIGPSAERRSRRASVADADRP
ncbi:MAG TPA: hypothetical protein VM618_01145 [Acidimicrobiia bacterium]|nr:hypothetical protein [Acidimicrobiia bacterium]